MSHRLPLAWLALYRRRRMLLALAAGLLVFEVLIAVVVRAVPPEEMFSSTRPVPRAFQAFSGSGGGVSLASVAGLLGAGLVHPFWIAMHLTAVASLAAAAVAADVEAGTIELIAVRPLSRARILGERALALVAAAVFLHAASLAGVLVGLATVPRLRDEVAVGGVLAAGVEGLALSLCVAGPALAASAIGRHKGQVIGAAVAVGAVGFALNFLAVAWAPARALGRLSPFRYYRPADALVGGGVAWGSTSVLMAVFVAGLAAALVLFERRDLTA